MTERRAAARKLAPFAVALAAALAAFAAGRCTAPHDEAPHAHDASEAEVWTCSMHPQIRSPEPGACPICGMDLVPLSAAREEQDPSRVTLSERARVLARVRTAPVERRGTGGAGVHMLGRVEYDETSLATVSAWIPGRIDRLHVEVTGQRVRRGQVLATLYSPDVYAAQQDLIAARRQLERLSGASELARSSAEAASEAARQRLRLLGIPEAELDRMARASAPSRSVAVRSPSAGTIVERMASEGAYVQTGAPLYRVADLSRVWVQLDAFERDLVRVGVGQTVELEVEALPGQRFEGRVAFVDPVVDRERRTARVRVEAENEAGQLRPGMFARAIVREATHDDAEAPLVVPASAPLFTGRRALVYVEVPDAERPTYEARTVRLGPRAGDVYPVVAGLREGERVVTHGAFALDADLQIRGGASMMTRPDDRAEVDEPVEVSAALSATLRGAIASYLTVQGRLAADDLAGARQAAGALAEALSGPAPDETPRALEAWRSIGEEARAQAARLSVAETIQDARGAFEPLSAQVARALRIFGNPTEQPLSLAYCPMAFDDRGAEWVQAEGAVDNAYFGAAMRTCGTLRATVAPGEHLVHSGARR